MVNGGQVSIINRLDRETSGLTLVAKRRTSAQCLHREMEMRRVSKEYLAMVNGWPNWSESEVDAPIVRKGSQEHSEIYLKQMVHSAGAAARTRFQVEARFCNGEPGAKYALVKAFPETGRMHQIRVHLAHLGHPVVGDKLYGRDEQCYLEFIRTGWTDALAAKLSLPRQALHCSRLVLPRLNLEWRSRLPEDLGSWAGDNLLAAWRDPAV